MPSSSRLPPFAKVVVSLMWCADSMPAAYERNASMQIEAGAIVRSQKARTASFPQWPLPIGSSGETPIGSSMQMSSAISASHSSLALRCTALQELRAAIRAGWSGFIASSSDRAGDPGGVVRRLADQAQARAVADREDHGPPAARPAEEARP